MEYKIENINSNSLAFFMYNKYNKYEKYNRKRNYFMKKDKYVGICKVGEKGQIVIPKEARNMFDINPGDSIIILCDKKKGIALVKSEVIEDISTNIFNKGE